MGHTETELKVLYPHLFVEIKPLKIGILEDLAERHQGIFSKTSIRKFLRKHTRSKAYQESLKSGSQRYDLAGTAVGTVTDQEIELGQLSKDVLATQSVATNELFELQKKLSSASSSQGKND